MPLHAVIFDYGMVLSAPRIARRERSCWRWPACPRTNSTGSIGHIALPMIWAS